MGAWKAGDVIGVDAQDDKLVFARVEGEIPAIEERVHMDLPRARDHWSPTAPAAPTAQAPGGTAASED